MLSLTSSNVEKVFLNCLFKDEEVEGKKMSEIKHVPVEGIITNIGFHPERLKASEGEIVELLSNLPDTFFESKGGGWSFLNMCVDKNEHQWGEQRNSEQLMMLGIGIGKVKILLPRAMWCTLPGGVPYLVVNE